MLRNDRFFARFWPAVAKLVSAHRAETRREVAGVLRLLPLRPSARILDIPCGFGRHAIELARTGFRVTGVDLSSKLLEKARRNAATQGINVEFKRGDMRRLRYRNRFDAVVNLFTSFGYFGEAGGLRVLGLFRRALRPKGWLLLHLVNRDWVLRVFRRQERVPMGDCVFTEDRSFDFATSIITSHMTMRRGSRVWRGTVRLRLYSCHELIRMLKRARFSRVRFFGDIAGGRLKPGSRWLVLLARR
jgi:SAM-dependent methyltransferase